MPFDPSMSEDSARRAAPVRVLAVDTPIGRIALHWAGQWDRPACAAGAPPQGALIRVVLAADALAAPPAPDWLAQPISAYFAGAAQPITLPVRLRGTPYQRRVWQAIAAIGPGATRTYGDLARELDSAPRAVGGACRANPCPLVVPCHRVVARNGLGGFAGDRDGRLRDIKRWLLAHEAAGGHPGDCA
jgi:methylated-DNA-[protein]-cysteine S-methyltransferase